MHTTPTGEWQFVNMSEPRKPNANEDVRRIVRVNAMRDFRKKQKLERQNEASLQPCPNAVAIEGRRVRSADDSNDESSVSRRPALASDFPSRYVPVDERWRNDAYLPSLEELRQMLQELDSFFLAEAPLQRKAIEAEDFRSHSTPKTAGNMLSGQAFARLLQEPSPKTLMDSGSLDVFNALPDIGNNYRYNAFVIHHFATVMANKCLPVDLDAGENPLVKIWLPHALQDIALFRATLTFSAVHIDILIGCKNNIKVLLQKSATIKAINEKISSPKYALSNFTIGAIAMVAATESIQGNYKELRIHMNALTKIVELRGGLENLGWSGVLHTFISRQDLLYSSTLAQDPAWGRTACCVFHNSALLERLPPDEHNNPNLVIDVKIDKALRLLFSHLRYLTDSLHQQNVPGTKKAMTTIEIIAFSKVRTAIEHDVITIARSNTKPRTSMSRDEYTLEHCSLAARIYIKCALQISLPMCSVLVGLKEEYLQLLRDGEKVLVIGIREKMQPGPATWALMMGSLLCTTLEEEDYFAQRIFKGTRAIGSGEWADMEALLKNIAWVDHLRTPVCRSVWARVEAINDGELRDKTMDL